MKWYVRTYPGSSKKPTILSHSLRRNLHAPFPPIQCCYIVLLGKAFKKNNHFGSDAGMHWATTLIKGARRDQCDVTTCRRMVVFCWRTRYVRLIIRACIYVRKTYRKVEKKLLFGITRSNVSAQDIVKHGEEINATSGWAITELHTAQAQTVLGHLLSC